MNAEPAEPTTVAASAGPAVEAWPEQMNAPASQAASDGRPMRSLAGDLTRRIFLLCLAATLLAGAVRLIQVYRQERANFDAAVAQVSHLHLKLLAKSLWDVEPAAVQDLLQQIANTPQVRTARVNLSTGEFFFAGPARPADEQRRLGDANFEIPGPDGSGRILGQLNLDFNQRFLREQLLGVMLRVAAVGLLLSLGFSGLTLLMLRRELRQPLQDLATFAAGLAPDKTPPPLQLARSARSHRDELDVVVDGFRTLRVDIESYVKERERRAEQLELAVARRTSDLQEVTRYLETMSRHASRFLNLSVDEYPAMVSATLRDISGHSSHCSLVIAEHAQDQATARCRFAWLAPHDKISGMSPGEPLLAGLLGELPAGWSVLRFESPAASEPERALAMQQHGVQAMVFCAYRGDSSTQILLALSSQPMKWIVRDDRLARMTADMLFNIMRHWQDQLALQHLHQELEQRSNTDSLTGLANRRWFDELKLEETRRAMRNGSTLALISIDVDFFKSYNDNYGHAQGDQCLLAVSRMIQQTFNRAGELPARVGGEEFTVLLPEVDLAQAMAQAERLRQCVSDLAIPHSGSPLRKVSISAGVFSIRPDRSMPGASAEQFIAAALEAADAALYRAKRGGRDRVSD
ncbi:GGDEF domain-containing protein [Roseateles sp. PN1]|uniref:GGDEF domain-containing protein n=1 Tax=Roseateles sp. PN1 TaxID=3137372 RepID=UPI0031386DD0